MDDQEDVNREWTAERHKDKRSQRVMNFFFYCYHFLFDFILTIYSVTLPSRPLIGVDAQMKKYETVKSKENYKQVKTSTFSFLFFLI